jgi:flagellar protein FlbD
VIIVTRLNGPPFAVNPDLIERADCSPDTVVTLVDGTKYVIAEPLERLIALIRDYRASVIAAASVQELTLRQDSFPARRRLAEADGGGDNIVVPLIQRDR